MPAPGFRARPIRKGVVRGSAWRGRLWLTGEQYGAAPRYLAAATLSGALVLCWLFSLRPFSGRSGSGAWVSGCSRHKCIPCLKPVGGFVSTNPALQNGSSPTTNLPYSLPNRCPGSTVLSHEKKTQVGG